jgi:hypothetical protein
MSEQAGKKKSWFANHKVITAILAIIVVGIIATATSSGNKNNTSTSSNTANTSAKTSTSTTSQSSTTPGLNQQANDGKLGFLITSFNCGAQSIDQPGDTDGMFVSTQGAPYCEMNLTIKGVSNVAQTFDDDAQYVYANGKQYSVDDNATTDANAAGDNCLLDPTVNPGTTITCTLAFDVPAGVTPTYAMVHDSAYSNGTKVNLQ